MRIGGHVCKAMQRGLLRNSILGALLLVAAASAFADTAAFDLVGPRIEMRVTRAGKTLAISEVPNLQAGDRLWIHPVLPADQSVRYQLVVAFLQGSTNPPPDDWFIKADTWTNHFRQEGIVITVPPGAQQALLFLAPDTGGGFSAVRTAVRSRPGVFVRAAHDLTLASFERSRLDTYLRNVRATSESDPQALKERSALLARTLSIKLNQDCFSQPIDQQESCLVQGKDQLLLQDGQSQSMVASLTSGSTADLIGAVSSTPVARGGYYSPYVGSIVDVARIMSSLRSPNFQYIPALSVPGGDQLNLRLNAAPSFHNPKSVLVVGLPPVDPGHAPTPRAIDPAQVLCLDNTSLVLPVEGAPLAFATRLGHDFALRLKDKSGKVIILPATPDPARGGFVVDTSALQPGELDPNVDGKLEGSWGFQPFTGPTFHFRSAQPMDWSVPPAQRAALVAGRDDSLDLRSSAAVCVESVSLQYSSAKPLKLEWKSPKPDQLVVQLPLKGETPGPFRLLISQYGLSKPDAVYLRAYGDEAKLDRFRVNAGDSGGVLIGARLDEVANLELSGVHFIPAKLSSEGSDDQLQLSAQNPATAAGLHAGAQLTAHVALEDGRVLDLPVTIEAPRPKVTLLSMTVQSGDAANFIRLGNAHELPQDGRVVFALKSEIPAQFPRTEKIEVSTDDDFTKVLLSVADGNLILQDSQSFVATLDPLKSFGPSAFGPLRFRPVGADGSAGDWQPLATLVRIPALKDVHCPYAANASCTLEGRNLYLVDSIASDPSFSHSVAVPFGYAAGNISVPRPDGTLLYIKLRDDPSTIDTVALPVLPDAPN
jgi:hypothetical protein